MTECQVAPVGFVCDLLRLLVKKKGEELTAYVCPLDGGIGVEEEARLKVQGYWKEGIDKPF